MSKLKKSKTSFLQTAVRDAITTVLENSPLNFENITITATESARCVLSQQDSTDPETAELLRYDLSCAKSTSRSINGQRHQLYSEIEEINSMNIVLGLSEEFVPIQLNVKSITEIENILQPCCSYYFKLKRDLFPIKFYFLSGNPTLHEELLKNSLVGGANKLLHITQRTRLEQNKIDDYEKRIYEMASHGVESLSFSIMLGLPTDAAGVDHNQNREDLGKISPVNNLIEYLDQKIAAGIISLPDEKKSLGILNIFSPTSPFVQRMLKQLIPNLVLDSTRNETESAEDFNSNFLILLITINKCDS